MRKKIVAILLAATMAIGITACGNQSESNKDDNTITVWCWDKTFNIFAMEEAAKIYQEDHQDVKIDIVEVGDVDVQSRLTTAGISGDLSTLPDIFLASTFAGSTELYDNILSCGAISTWTPAGDSDAYAVPNEFFSGDAVFEKIVDYSTKVPSIITGPYFNEARDAISVATTNITNGADLEKELKKTEDTVNFNMGQ